MNSLKIDGSFIEKLETNVLEREIVRSICAIGQALNITVVAERIETAGELSILKDLGVSLGQGYLLHRPEPLNKTIARLTSEEQTVTA